MLGWLAVVVVTLPTQFQKPLHSTILCFSPLCTLDVALSESLIFFLLILLLSLVLLIVRPLSPFLLSRSSFCFASIFVDQRVKPGFFPWDFSDSVYLSRFPFSLSSHLPYIPSPVLCASQVASLRRLSSVYTVKCPALISIGKHCKFLLTRLPSRNHVKLVESNEYRPCRESM